MTFRIVKSSEEEADKVNNCIMEKSGIHRACGYTMGPFFFLSNDLLFFYAAMLVDEESWSANSAILKLSNLLRIKK